MSDLSSSKTPGQPVEPVTRARVFAIAWPIVLSNATVPLLGLADTAVIGHTGDAAMLGAIAVGAMIFTFLYWGFGFLRMGTTGLVAQALGARDEGEVSATLMRALLFGGAMGLVLMVLQIPLARAAFALTGGSEAVEDAANLYFHIRVWGAPATLATYALLGFFIGLQQTRTVLILQLVLNGLNILLDVLFVIGLGMGVAGVALGTLTAEVVAAALGLVLALRELKRRNPGMSLIPLDWPRILDRPALLRTITVNVDIMIRTLCLIFAFAWFVNQGAIAGDTILAANAILMQFVSFAAFFLDGFAFSAESLIGEAAGAKSRQRLKEAVRFSTELAFGTAAAISLIFLIGGDFGIRALTSVPEVREAARAYLPWVIWTPVVSVWCFQLDGIFIGATRTADMRNAMVASLAIYLLAFLGFGKAFGNHGLWASMMVFYLARTVTLYWQYPGLVAAVTREDP